MPSCSIWGASRFHSFFASSSNHFGQVGAFFSGIGSCLFSGRLPGFPCSIFIAVGVGFRPLVAISENKTSFETKNNQETKKDLWISPQILCVCVRLGNASYPAALQISATSSSERIRSTFMLPAITHVPSICGFVL